MRKVLRSVIYNVISTVFYIELPVIFGFNDITYFILLILASVGILVNMEDGLSRKRITKRNNHYLNAVVISIIAHFIIIISFTNLNTEITIITSILFLLSLLMNNNYRIAMEEKMAKIKNKNR